VEGEGGRSALKKGGLDKDQKKPGPLPPELCGKTFKTYGAERRVEVKGSLDIKGKKKKEDYRRHSLREVPKSGFDPRSGDEGTA